MTKAELGTGKLGPSKLRHTNNLIGTKDRAVHPEIRLHFSSELRH